MDSHQKSSPFTPLGWNKVFILALFALLLPFGYSPVSAHDVQPTKSEPAEGTALPQPPAKVAVWFPEEAAAVPVADGQSPILWFVGGAVAIAAVTLFLAVRRRGTS